MVELAIGIVVWTFTIFILGAAALGAAALVLHLVLCVIYAALWPFLKIASFVRSLLR
jgi:hypothetical protein